MGREEDAGATTGEEDTGEGGEATKTTRTGSMTEIIKAAIATVTIIREEVTLVTGITESEHPSRCTPSHHHTHTSLKKRDNADKCEKTKGGAQEAPPAVDFWASILMNVPSENK